MIRIVPCSDGVVVIDGSGFLWTAEIGTTARAVSDGEVPALRDSDPERHARIKARYIAEHGDSDEWDE